MNASDLYVRITSSDGSASIQCFRAWDKERMLKSLNAQYSKQGSTLEVVDRQAYLAAIKK